MSRLFATLVAASCGLVAGAAQAQPVVSYTKSGTSFEEVRENLRLAIEGRGLVVDYQARIGKMLERTGGDLGATKPLYADVQTLQFCSAKLSRKTMEADLRNAVMCPYSIVVYAPAAQPDQVVVAYRRMMNPRGGPASRAALGEVEALLDSIAKEAVGRK